MRPRFFSRAFRRRDLALISIKLTEALSSMNIGAVCKGVQAPANFAQSLVLSCP